MEHVNPAYAITGVCLVVIVYAINYFYTRDKKFWNGGKCKRCGQPMQWFAKGPAETSIYNCANCGNFIKIFFSFKREGT